MARGHDRDVYPKSADRMPSASSPAYVGYRSGQPLAKGIFLMYRATLVREEIRIRSSNRTVVT